MLGAFRPVRVIAQRLARFKSAAPLISDEVVPIKSAEDYVNSLRNRDLKVPPQPVALRVRRSVPVTRTSAFLTATAIPFDLPRRTN